mmetsp:Transcript_77000/g.238479  ORF Transcript_77000/g.238479 Transcript_77000/m.238479 type:complete len:235 (+) Transcript_77000:1256-1960(+)
MSTMVSVATLWSDIRCLSFSADSYSVRNFSRSSMNRRRPCWISLSIACRSSCSRTRASSRSWRICRAAPATSASARRRSSRILSHSDCFCPTNSCQTRAFSSSNSWRSLRSVTHSSWICCSAFSSQRVKVFRMSPTMTLNSSCEASRTGASSSGTGAPARPGGSAAEELAAAPVPPPPGAPRLEGGAAVVPVPTGFPTFPVDAPPKARMSSSGERMLVVMEAAEFILGSRTAPT